MLVVTCQWGGTSRLSKHKRGGMEESDHGGIEERASKMEIKVCSVSTCQSAVEKNELGIVGTLRGGRDQGSSQKGFKNAGRKKNWDD